MYALGELTNGTFFFTSALEIIARHARLCATRLAEGDVVADRESVAASRRDTTVLNPRGAFE